MALARKGFSSKKDRRPFVSINSKRPTTDQPNILINKRLCSKIAVLQIQITSRKKGKVKMYTIKAIHAEPENIEQAVTRLKMVLQKYAGGDLQLILEKHTFKFEELLSLLESSLVAQKDELDRLRKDAKRLTKQIDSISQGQLI